MSNAEEAPFVLTTEVALTMLQHSGAYTAPQLYAMELPPIQWVIPGLMPTGYTLISAAPKKGKSFLGLGLAVAVATGAPALGKLVLAGIRPVLVIALEDGKVRLLQRLRAIGVAEAPAGITFVDEVPDDQDDAWLWATRLIEGFILVNTGAVVILDTFGHVAGPRVGTESEYQRDVRLGRVFKRICAHHRGASIWVVHHERKAEAADFMQRAIGTQGLTGTADTVVSITRDRGSDDAVLDVDGRDLQGAATIAMRFTDDRGWQLAGEDLTEAAVVAEDVRATQGLGGASAEVVRYIRDEPEPVSSAMVKAHLPGMDPATVDAKLHDLAKRGRIRRLERGLWTGA